MPKQSNNQNNLYEYAQFYLVYILIYMLYGTIMYSIAQYYKIDQLTLLVVHFAGLFVLWFVSQNSFSIIMMHIPFVPTSPDIANLTKKSFAKSLGRVENDFVTLTIEDAAPNVFLVRKLDKFFVVYTSGALVKLNELDVNAISVYFGAVSRSRNLLSDSIYLLIATLLERVIIFKTLSKAFIALAMKSNEKSYYDLQTLNISKNSVGYKNSLLKFKRDGGSLLPFAFSIAGFVDVERKVGAERSQLGEIDGRAEAVGKA